MIMTLEKILTLSCTVLGAVSITISLPELLYYAPPIHVIGLVAGIIVGGAGVRSILKG
jgi:hypothetical protein